MNKLNHLVVWKVVVSIHEGKTDGEQVGGPKFAIGAGIFSSEEIRLLCSPWEQDQFIEVNCKISV